ncbi:LysE family transporter [Kribbella solani]|uniref:LysE family transporter n=2 Tax=Kribbella solani TaxID=236067 RepID=UPI0029B73668|nr:LysE family transporter [Kribbella solani]MDX2973740.1 LysE family transporter [Kribbella solani]MDX3002104.1 LysE family transporter [Kribbella solani]
MTAVAAALVAGALAGLGVAMPVGPVGTYLVGLTARTSWRIGVFAALGVATADGAYAAVAALAGSALSPVLAPLLTPLRWASAFVLIALATTTTFKAVRTYRAHRLTTIDQPPPPSPRTAYLTLLGMTLLNPWTAIYFAALILGNTTNPSGHGAGDGGSGSADGGGAGLDGFGGVDGSGAGSFIGSAAGERVAFVLAAFVASAAWQLLLAGGGAILGRLLTGTRGRLATAVASSTLITILAVRLLQ